MPIASEASAKRNMAYRFHSLRILIGLSLMLIGLIPAGLHISVCLGLWGHMHMEACDSAGEAEAAHVDPAGRHGACEHNECLDLCFFLPERDLYGAGARRVVSHHELGIAPVALVPQRCNLTIPAALENRPGPVVPGRLSASSGPDVLRTVILII